MDLKGKLTRRDMLKLSGGALAGASLIGVAGCGKAAAAAVRAHPLARLSLSGASGGPRTSPSRT